MLSCRNSLAVRATGARLLSSSSWRLLRVTEEEDGRRLDRMLRARLGLSYGKVQKAFRQRAVRQEDGAVLKPSARPLAGSQLKLASWMVRDQLGDGGNASGSAAMSEKQAEWLRETVLWKGDRLLVVNKPAGLAVQGGTGTVEHLDGMLDALRFGSRQRPRLVHRLDKETSGLLVLARDAHAASALTRLFRRQGDGYLHKTYWALLHDGSAVGDDVMSRGRINAAVGKRGAERKKAVTAYECMARGELEGLRLCWMQMKPYSGRKHQLRLHATEQLASPIVGDGKYGSKRQDEALAELLGKQPRLHLHAAQLSLFVPELDELKLTLRAPLPEHMARSWDLLGWPVD